MIELSVQTEWQTDTQKFRAKDTKADVKMKLRPQSSPSELSELHKWHANEIIKGFSCSPDIRCQYQLCPRKKTVGSPAFTILSAPAF